MTTQIHFAKILCKIFMRINGKYTKNNLLQIFVDEYKKILSKYFITISAKYAKCNNNNEL